MFTGINEAGDFELEVAKLKTSSGKVIDLSASIIAITIFEDTGMSAVTGNILLQDSFALTSLGPIIGQEYLYLKISTPTLTHKSAVIDFTENIFLIHSLENRTDVGNNVQMYVLNFSTSEIMKNQRTKVSQILKGAYSDIVTNMLHNFVDCKKDMYIEPSSGNKKIIAPNIRPFDVIGIATKEAISRKFEEPTYMFFETMKGYHFRSLASMYAEGPVMTYKTYVPGGNIIQKGPGIGSIDIIKDLSQVLNYQVVANTDTLINYTTGTYASNLFVHDIFNKRFKNYKHDAFSNFHNEHHITHFKFRGKDNNLNRKGSSNDFPIYSHLAIEENGKTIADFPARTYVMPVSEHDTTEHSDASHITSNNTYPFASYNPQNWVQRRNSQMMLLEQGFLVNILTHGNTLINAGDIVELDLPYKAAIKTTKKEQSDRFYKGNFFIKRIRHDFDFTEAKHKTHLTLVKDSLEDSLDGPEDNWEPKPGGRGSLFNTKDDFYQNI